MMNHIFANMLDVWVIVYLDDILIFTGEGVDHAAVVRRVLEKLREYRLFCKASKCKFDVTEVEYLGYLVSTQGVRMDPGKVDVVMKWLAPTTVHEIQVFLGFANYYRRFITGYSKIVAPITELLKGKAVGKVAWSADQQSAFDELKWRFRQGPILQHFEPKHPILLETDASDQAIAAAMSQPTAPNWAVIGNLPSTLLDMPEGKPRWHPVAFCSRKLDSAERNYNIHNKELLAIVDAFRQWQQYCKGAKHKVTVLTDHCGLEYFATKRYLNQCQVRWQTELADIDFVIKYRSGLQCKVDGLTRRPDMHAGANAHNPDNEQTLLGPERWADKDEVTLRALVADHGGYNRLRDAV
ncbi:FOG: Transposon-encoded proteins with TYA, reverse transcriptase, integrase domains in various combinations [Ceraceosorus bombacis]|uniref:FOG: Transposon-encoded proteins with TYA, reverse transcriptase, integrase domains in various combinations n=1 Tax=Ceraceosorus bombacis TaxID=401625 RepID=A0A0P1BER6_9BASI|nr:FOG: Transposon-encoded proteins with TYA, reverse transcriptase, integrase domains in various combinations [Ceraceosorus bombacis]